MMVISKEWREEFDGWIESNQRKHAALILVATWQKKGVPTSWLDTMGPYFHNFLAVALLLKKEAACSKKFDPFMLFYSLGYYVHFAVKASFCPFVLWIIPSIRINRFLTPVHCFIPLAPMYILSSWPVTPLWCHEQWI